MQENDLPIFSTWESEVADSTEHTFSDKLMMFYTTALIALSIGFYGASMSTSSRRDIALQYTKLTAEITKFAEDGANILINSGWLEQPPITIYRNKLSSEK